MVKSETKEITSIKATILVQGKDSSDSKSKTAISSGEQIKLYEALKLSSG